MNHAVEEAHQRLVDQLIAFGDLWSQALIEAFRNTPRHYFLDRVYEFERPGGWEEIPLAALGPRELALIYSDRVLTTRLSEDAGRGSGVAISSSSQPSLMAQMLEDLQPGPDMRVLEIGAGTGYNAALLARVVAEVVSIDVDRRVLAEAREHLQAFPGRSVALHHSDGRAGWPERAPYDRIMVTASTPDLEPAWLDQAAEGGLILAPLDLAPGLAYTVRGQVTGGDCHGRLTRPAFFMPLRDEQPARASGGRQQQGAHAPRSSVARSGPGRARSARLPSHERLTSLPAPWADWSDRKNNPEIAQLPHALAFLGWLSGLVINYVSLSDGRPGYGLADRAMEQVCWIGQRHWYVNGAPGRELGVRLWRTFLEAGGPRPTEFQVRARPIGAQPESFPLAPESSLLTYHRQGPSCCQTWFLSEPRNRL
jgi:protein-L-isoaspartate(D-aspartate) O-methyltransferase